jgi:hypothetical protein
MTVRRAGQIDGGGSASSSTSASVHQRPAGKIAAIEPLRNLAERCPWVGVLP